jgi:hypothetical protein
MDTKTSLLRSSPPHSFIFHYDAGHGWLQVDKNWLSALGIAKEISGYSYAHRGYVYLEEDADAQIFIDAYRKWFSMKPTFTEVDDGDDSVIRNYDGYRG